MKISILADPSIGGTFLSWSFYFLSGQHEYYCCLEKKYKKLINNPLTTTNSHNFQPNFIQSFSQLLSMDQQINNQYKENDLHVYYMHPINEFDCSITRNVVDFLINNSDFSITVTAPENYSFYNKTFVQRSLNSKLCNPTKKNQSDSEQVDDFFEFYFAESKHKWESLSLIEIWDKREFYALNLRPYKDSFKISQYLLDFSASNNYYVDAPDVWMTLDSSIQDMFTKCNLSIDMERFDEWLSVYQDWRLFHYQRIKFCWYFPVIIDAIIRGKSMDLCRFDLDIIQEAIIQHELIYKHNLNLKTFNVVKFENTLQLHKLLEENFHLTEKIYNADL